MKTSSGPLNDPIAASGGTAVLYGNIAHLTDA